MRETLQACTQQNTKHLYNIYTTIPPKLDKCYTNILRLKV